ncbi:hypothetical protein CHUUTOTORO_00070 [Serratia phage vB_SmaM-ChuuTotoro]|nr:hypothetical protein CHUUTOTORO_00070 [Serratia phage vB_SmaM-ChuuTotoro]
MQATRRTYSLTIGRPVYIGEKPTSIEKYASSQGRGGEAYLITGLNIEFDIMKDKSKEPNKGYVTVYNLADETVAYLDQNQRESLAVLFHAGYDGDDKLIFSGTVEFMQDSWDGPTRKTKLILGDGVLNLTTATTARSYRAGTPVDQVVNDLITDLKLPKGRVVGSEGATLQHSMAFSGNASQNLANLAKNTGSSFSVQDGAVYWTKEGSRFSQVMFEISEETGMRGSPTPQNPEPKKRRLAKQAEKKTKTTTKDGKPKLPTHSQVREDAGLVVETLLNGAILPESTVYLKSRQYTGFYKVVQIKHKGQLEGGDWTTELALAETRGQLVK